MIRAWDSLGYSGDYKLSIVHDGDLIFLYSSGDMRGAKEPGQKCTEVEIIFDDPDELIHLVDELKTVALNIRTEIIALGCNQIMSNRESE